MTSTLRLSLVALAIAGLIGTGAVVEHWRMTGKVEKIRQEHTAQVAAVEKQRADAEAKNRQVENRIEEARNDERNKRSAEVTALATTIASTAGQRDSLRQQLAAAQKRASAAAKDPATRSVIDAGTDNASVLRYVVGSCTDRYVGVAEEADRLGIQVRGLQAHVRAVATQD